MFELLVHASNYKTKTLHCLKKQDLQRFECIKISICNQTTLYWTRRIRIRGQLYATPPPSGSKGSILHTPWIPLLISICMSRAVKKGRTLLLASPLFVNECGKREGQDNPSSFSAMLMQCEIKRGILGVCNIEPLDPEGGGVAYN